MIKFDNKNIIPKLFAVFFALIIWVYVMDESNPVKTRDEQNIPIDFLNMESMEQAGLVIKGETDDKIRVRFSGRRDVIQNISRNQIKASVDLLGFRAGINSIPVEVTMPGDVEVDYNPKYIRVELEEIISKQKPIKVTIEGVPRKGYTLGELQYEPRIVWVEGAESLVNSVEAVEAVIKLSEESQNVSTLFPLRPVNARGEEIPNLKLQTSHVNVDLPVNQLKTVDIYPVVEASPAEGYEITSIVVEPGTVTIKGQQEILADINRINTEAVNLNNLSANIEQKVKLEFPEGAVEVDSLDAKILITVEPLIEKEFEILRRELEFRNLDTGLKVDKSEIPETLRVRIVATERIMTTIRKENIKVVVDMEGLGENQHSVEPLVEVPLVVERRVKEIRLEPKSLSISVMIEDD